MTDLELEIQDICNQILYYPNKIYEIFCDYFGEDKVDLQVLSEKTIKDFFLEECNKNLEELLENKNSHLYNFYNLYRTCVILVHFPEVKITNEYDEYVNIKDLWAKVEFDYKGKIKGNFKLSRSTYFLSHVNSDYAHSHCPGVSPILEFKDCCLGTGPIKNTIHSLMIGFDEDLLQLFCFELDKYVATESVQGVPYRRISSIKKVNLSNPISDFVYKKQYNIPAEYRDVINDFVTDFIKSKKIKLNYFNNSYGLGMPFMEYILTISNHFIEWYNNSLGTYNFDTLCLFSDNILEKVAISNNKIYTKCNSRSSHHLEKQGQTMFTFKGKEVCLNIIDDSEEDEGQVIILNVNIATAILKSILKTFNYNYGK